MQLAAAWRQHKWLPPLLRQPVEAISRCTGGPRVGIMHWSEGGVGEFALLVVAWGIGGLVSAASMMFSARR
jgi:hypothetical protein